MENPVKYLFLQNENGVMTPEEAAFIDACQQKNWLDQQETFCWTAEAAHAEAVLKQSILLGHGPATVIPIGSIEFVQSYLKRFNLPELKAMNIPEPLQETEFTARKVWNAADKAQVRKLCEEEGKTLLVKPGLHPKRFEAVLSTYLDELPDDEPLFVSEILTEDIVAEWRAFTLRGRILSIHPYILNRWVVPYQPLVEEMAQRLEFPACALDVAVLKTERTVILEAHPFISCGLYGFEGPYLLNMATTAWREQLKGR